MLTRKKCKKALQSWEASKKDAEKLINLIPPNFVFQFQQAEIRWLRKFNKSNHFHAYMGVYDGEVILMLFPLNVDGGELRLKEYPYTPLTCLKAPLTFVQQETKVCVSKSVLSTDLKLIARTQEDEVPLFDHDISSQDTLIQEITDWRKFSADWLFQQVEEFDGESIFNVFDIPLEDLGTGDADVVGIFGFKKLEVFRSSIPTIIFLQGQQADQLSTYAKIDNIESNAYNWSQPCPPFCRPKKTYSLYLE